MTDKTCATCAAYGEGECHRYAPKPFTFGQSREEPDGGSVSHFLTTWPQTSKWDWCAEWLPETPDAD